MLEDFQKNRFKKQVPWQVSTYALLVPNILDALKSITGKVFIGYQGYEEWWALEGKKFEVVDP